MRERVSALILCNTKAGADNDEARANRLQSAEDVEKRGVEPFIESMIPKLLGQTTRSNRPDLVEDGARDDDEDDAGRSRGGAARHGGASGFGGDAGDD